MEGGLGNHREPILPSHLHPHPYRSHRPQASNPLSIKKSPKIAHPVTLPRPTNQPTLGKASLSFTQGSQFQTLSKEIHQNSSYHLSYNFRKCFHIFQDGYWLYQKGSCRTESQKMLPPFNSVFCHSQARGGWVKGGRGIGMAPRGLLRARVTIANYHQINCNTEGMDMEDVKIIRKQDHLRVHKIKQSP